MPLYEPRCRKKSHASQLSETLKAIGEDQVRTFVRNAIVGQGE